MILGLGNDIIEIARIAASIEEFGEKFYQKLFTEKEIAYCLSHKKPEMRFAGRFAAKEALSKALGTGFGEKLHWHDLEILNNEKGRPEVFLSKKLKRKLGYTTFLITISHCNTYAIATAVWITKPPGLLQKLFLGITFK